MVCTACRSGQELEFGFSMAFQPIVDVEAEAVYAFEALVRGTGGEGAGFVLGQVTDENRYAFDQSCRVRAIETAVAAGLMATPARLSINFLPGAVYSPAACIQLTLKTAGTHQLPVDRLIFEFTESERVEDPAHLQNIITTYKKMGFGTAMDDFGAGHSGLSLLASFQPETVKLDRELISGIDSSLPRRLIVEGVVRMCQGMGVRIVAEGVETLAEVEALRALGVRYMQGFHFARPAFERLPAVSWQEAALQATG